MNLSLLVIGMILLLLGYLIGVDQRIQFTTFLRKKRVLDRQKVAEIIGGSQFILGAFLITLGGIGFKKDLIAVAIVLMILLVNSVYVMKNYVE